MEALLLSLAKLVCRPLLECQFLTSPSSCSAPWGKTSQGWFALPFSPLSADFPIHSLPSNSPLPPPRSAADVCAFATRPPHLCWDIELPCPVLNHVYTNPGFDKTSPTHLGDFLGLLQHSLTNESAVPRQMEGIDSEKGGGEQRDVYGTPEQRSWNGFFFCRNL